MYVKSISWYLHGFGERQSFHARAHILLSGLTAHKMCHHRVLNELRNLAFGATHVTFMIDNEALFEAISSLTICLRFDGALAWTSQFHTNLVTYVIWRTLASQSLNRPFRKALQGTVGGGVRSDIVLGYWLGDFSLLDGP